MDANFANASLASDPRPVFLGAIVSGVVGVTVSDGGAGGGGTGAGATGTTGTVGACSGTEGGMGGGWVVGTTGMVGAGGAKELLPVKEDVMLEVEVATMGVGTATGAANGSAEAMEDDTPGYALAGAGR